VAQEATRRGVLATGLTAAGLAATGLGLPLLVGCKGIGALGTPPRPLPDVSVATSAIAGERALIAQYGAVLRAMPGLAGQLHPLLAQHTEHLARLRGRLNVPAGASQPAIPGGTSTAGSGTSTAASGSPPPVPATPAAALASLRAAENTASAALASHLTVVSPSFAQLLASISASEAAHALLLHPRGHAQ